MNKQVSKEKIYQTALQKQQDLIDNFTSRVNEMKEDVFEHDHSASQSENRQTGKLEVLSHLESELTFAKAEMSFLGTLSPEQENEKVEPGALVITNIRSFYVAVSSEVMEVDGEEIFGISTRAPLYKVMEGLSAGESFEFNKTRYQIEAIY